MARICFLLLGILLASIGCAQQHNEPSHKVQQLFDSILADRFDFPVGTKDGRGDYTDAETGKQHTGWYVAADFNEVYSLGLHTGEDWNGRGGGNTDLGQPVRSIAKGVVIAAADYGSTWGNIVVVEHRYVENAKVKKVRSLYAHLERISVSIGDTLARRQELGTIGTGNDSFLAHLHLEIRKASAFDLPVDYWPSSHGKNAAWIKQHYHNPTTFIRKHRKLELPAEEENLIVADKKNYRFHRYAKGKYLKSYDLALSQNPIGHKQVEGDNRTPEGAYRIIQKSRGPFGGDYAAFFGTGWMRLNYPNTFDAQAGLKDGRINPTEFKSILNAHEAGKEPPKTTALGGGIGIHGWAGTWEPDGTQNLTWGCLSWQNDDLDVLFDELPLGTAVFILP